MAAGPSAGFCRALRGTNKGVDSLRRCVRACVQRGVGVLTVFAFRLKTGTVRR
jgi:undecaprenyl pyrophosphate synthase